MRITFLGDIMLTREQLEQFRAGTEYDFSALSEEMRGRFSASDYVIANLETPIAGAELGYTHEMYSFNSPEAFLDTLREMGVSMVQTANNHCLDRGVEGLFNTIKNVRSSGMDCIGTHLQKEDSYKIVSIGGVSTGILAFTYGTNAFANQCYLNDSNSYCVDLLQRQELSGRFERVVYTSSFYPIQAIKRLLEIVAPKRYKAPVYERPESSKAEEERLREQIRKCREAGAEYVIALLHIGGQYNAEPSEYTKRMCRFCVQCGADLVVANHEHVIHPYEWQNSSNTGLCLYSLGNYLSANGVLIDPFHQTAEYSVVLHADIARAEGRLRSRFGFQLFCNHLNDAGLLVCDPVTRVLERSDDEAENARIASECNRLLNRIYQTENQSYPVQDYYRI